MSATDSLKLLANEVGDLVDSLIDEDRREIRAEPTQENRCPDPGILIALNEV